MVRTSGRKERQQTDRDDCRHGRSLRLTSARRTVADQDVCINSNRAYSNLTEGIILDMKAMHSLIPKDIRIEPASLFSVGRRCGRVPAAISPPACASPARGGP